MKINQVFMASFSLQARLTWHLNKHNFNKSESALQRSLEGLIQLFFLCTHLSLDLKPFCLIVLQLRLPPQVQHILSHRLYAWTNCPSVFSRSFLQSSHTVYLANVGVVSVSYVTVITWAWNFLQKFKMVSSDSSRLTSSVQKTPRCHHCWSFLWSLSSQVTCGTFRGKILHKAG